MSSITFEKALRASHAYNLIKNDFNTTLGHAYMIVSSDEEVLDDFFTLVACSIYCNDHSACLECSDCLKVLHNNHEDIIHIVPDKNQIKVEGLKDLLDTVYLKSYSGKKLYFIHRADLMNTQAQNKILKTLEEPPKEATIFLGVANESGILDTIKSRTRTINIDLFNIDVIKETLISLGCDEETASIAASCSEGMLGKARKIALSPDYADLYKSAFLLLENLNKSPDVVVNSSLVANQKEIDKFFDVLSIVIRDMMVAKDNNSLILSKHEENKIIQLSEKYSKKALAEILNKITEERKKLSILPQKTIGDGVADDLLFFMLEAKHKWQ